MIIRQITLDDQQQYLELIHKAYQSVEALGIHFAAATADLDFICEHITNNAVYGLQKSGQLVSTLSIRFPWGNNPGPYGLPHLGWFATDPDYKQLGLGNELMQWVEEHILINVLKAPAVTLGTAENHPWLIKMYEKHHFRRIGHANLGHGHTTIYLQKILNEALYQNWQNRQCQTNPQIV